MTWPIVRGNDCLNAADDIGATFAQTFAFRVGKLGNFASWLMTTKEAPYVWNGLEYRIEKTGSVRVQFSGSYIPSHRFYVGWKSCGGHDMLEIGSAKIDGFFGTGRDRFAPGMMLVDWNGEGDFC